MTVRTAWTGWLRRLVGGGEPRDRAELTDDLRLHRYFLSLAAEGNSVK